MTKDISIRVVGRKSPSLTTIAKILIEDKSGYYNPMSLETALDLLSKDVVDSAHSFYLAKYQSIPAGFLHAFHSSRFRRCFGQRDYELQVSIVPEYQEKGVASCLVYRAIADARKMGIQQVCAYIYVGNKRSQAFFSSLGFQIEIDEGTWSYRATFAIKRPYSKKC